jgi:hypothetical protein
MNCQNVREYLLAYLDNEINPSERMLIQSHLAGCDSCQAELTTLSATRSRVSQFLVNRAAQAAPSPQALSHLQAKLAQRPSSWLSLERKRSAPNANPLQPNQKGFSLMKNKFAFSALALMLILVATVAIVPPVRAQAEQLFGFVFHITAADGTPISTITNQAGEGMGFQIMQPTYQPAAFKDSLIGNGMVTSTGETADATNSELSYQDPAGEKFLVLKQTKANSGETLPAGQATSVNGKPAVLESGLSGDYPGADPALGTLEASGSVSVDQAEPGTHILTPNADPNLNTPAITLQYKDAIRLTWVDGNTRLEILSNLSPEEIMKFAAGLVPAR